MSLCPPVLLSLLLPLSSSLRSGSFPSFWYHSLSRIRNSDSSSCSASIIYFSIPTCFLIEWVFRPFSFFHTHSSPLSLRLPLSPGPFFPFSSLAWFQFSSWVSHSFFVEPLSPISSLHFSMFHPSPRFL